MDARSSTIPGYGLERPTGDDLALALAKVIGPQKSQSAVASAMYELRLESKLAALSSAELSQLALLLTKKRGLVSVLARSFWIRLSNYETLASVREDA